MISGQVGIVTIRNPIYTIPGYLYLMKDLPLPPRVIQVLGEEVG